MTGVSAWRLPQVPSIRAMTRLLLALVSMTIAVAPAPVSGQTSPARGAGQSPAAVGGADSAQNPPLTLTLDQALQFALEHYPGVKAALEQINVSAADVDAAKTAYLPRLDSVWQTNRGTANNTFGQVLPQSVVPGISGPVLPSASGQTVWGSAVGALFSWEPFDFGQRGAAVREAEAAVDRARAEDGVTRLTVQSAVGSAFLAVVTAEQALSVAEADVRRRDVLARSAHTLANNQLRPGAEASRADAELAAARTRVIRAREALALERVSLEKLLGVSSRPVNVDAARLLTRTEPAAVASGEAARHPFVQAEQAALDLARARETTLATSDRPRVYLQSSASARGSGANPSGIFDGGADGLFFERANWAAGVQVVFPNLFDVSNLRARRAAATAASRAETARYDEALLTVTSQQRAANAMVDAALAIAENMPIQLTAAQQGEAQARARYEAGLAGITEVAEAQNLLAAAEYQDAAARVDIWRALLTRAVAQGNLDSFVGLLREAGGR